MSKIIEAFILHKDTMNGGEDMNIAYLDKRVAQMRADEITEEWISYEVKPVKVRTITESEGAVGKMLVSFDRQTAKDATCEAALRKLTKEERAALGI